MGIVELRDKYVLITGGTNGIGLAAAKALGARGARFGLVARNVAKAKSAAAEIRAAGGEVADIFQAELTSQASVRTLIEDVAVQAPPIDVLVNNAGAMYGSHQLSPDGIELTWALNVLAPFLITTRLTDHLAPGARVVFTASDEHTKVKAVDFDHIDGSQYYSRTAKLTGGALRRYGESKLALIMLSAELARRFPAVHSYSFEPGFVATGFNTNNGLLMRAMMAMAKPFARTPDQGAETLVWLATSPEVATESGLYYTRNHRADPSPAAQDTAAAARLWELCSTQTSG
ncbi:SDR family NAD(P)-dependent oxidoreductase [Kribbella monticola]|uniref:SDR family NAD(P)-dependent oxidoreductase n=1 Tax=Kribbella monticola TaxID=2185285 RepID=UPI0018E562A9|nr:SDR family NAD(P)-dependent oxidoreductase [Kribbella monticola]